MVELGEAGKEGLSDSEELEDRLWAGAFPL